MPKPRYPQRRKLNTAEKILENLIKGEGKYNRHTPELLNKIVASAIKKGIITVKDFRNNFSSVYRKIQNKKVNGIGFIGYGSWEKYLEKVHKISLLDTSYTKERLNSIVKYALKQGFLTPKDFEENNLSSVYEIIRSKEVNGIGFMGYGSWAKYLEKVHKISLLDTSYTKERLNSIVKYVLRKGILTPKDFEENNLYSIYQAIRKRKVKGIGFMGYGSWEKYLEKVHNFSLTEHKTQQRIPELNKEVANALKQGFLTPKDFKENNLYSIYQAIYATKINGINFLGHGGWVKYLLAEHKELLKKLDIDLDKSFKNKIIALEKLDSAQKKYNILELIEEAKQGKLSLLFEKKQKPKKKKMTPEEIDNVIAELLEKYKYNQEYFSFSKMPKEFKKYYKSLRKMLGKPKIDSNSESFRGYGTWANYLKKVHKISLYRDKVYRSRQAFTKKELEFIRKKKGEITSLFFFYVRQKGIKLSTVEIEKVLERIIGTAARNFNPKKAKLSTYIYKISEFLIKKSYRNNKTLSLDFNLGKEDNLTLKNIIPAKEQPLTRPNNEKILTLNILEKLYVDKKLKPNEVLIFLAHFSGNTLEEIGLNLGLTRERVRQIEKNVVVRIKKQL